MANLTYEEGIIVAWQTPSGDTPYCGPMTWGEAAYHIAQIRQIDPSMKLAYLVRCRPRPCGPIRSAQIL